MTTCRPGDGLIRRRRWDSDRKQGAQPGQGGRWGGEAATLSRSCLPGAAQRARGRSEGRGAPCRGPRAEAPSSARPVRGGGSCSFVQSVLTSQSRPAGPDGGRPTASGSRSFPGAQPALSVPGRWRSVDRALRQERGRLPCGSAERRGSRTSKALPAPRVHKEAKGGHGLLLRNSACGDL